MKRPSVSSSIKNDIQPGHTRTRTGMKLPSEMKPTPMKSRPMEEEKKGTPGPLRTRNTLPVGPKSTEKDEVDDIYKESDPIGVSLAKRKKAGTFTSVVADKNSKQGKFFFTLKVKGNAVAVTEE